jgi:hypothetical protein
MKIKQPYDPFDEYLEPKGYGLVHVEMWKEARSLAHRMTRWIFRGQSNEEWPLASSIETAASLHLCESEYIWEREDWMLKQFRRRAHHYLPSPPDAQQAIEWLSLIQHYGGATRLLDFTHSFYVASFFAVEKAEQDAAVWAVNLTLLEQAVCQHFSQDFTKIIANDVFLELANENIGSETIHSKVVLSVEPFRLYERIASQQGLFLFPLNLRMSFESNFAATFYLTEPTITEIDHKDPFLNLCQYPLVKIVIPRKCHKSALTDLKNMNITAAALFPGLDGFARSLNFGLRSHEADSDYFVEQEQAHNKLKAKLKS